MAPVWPTLVAVTALIRGPAAGVAVGTGDGVAVGDGAWLAVPTTKVALTVLMPLAVDALIEIVCVPSATLAVFQAMAVELSAVPRKSHGAAFSVRIAVDVIAMSSSQKMTAVAVSFMVRKT